MYNNNFLEEPKRFFYKIGRQLAVYERCNNYVTIISLVEAIYLSKTCPLCNDSSINNTLGKQIQKMCHFETCFLNILMLSFIKLFKTLIAK